MGDVARPRDRDKPTRKEHNMPGIKRTVFAGLIGLLAALAMAAPAHAAVVKAACTVDGEAKLSDKAAPNDSTRGMRITGGHGFYSFKGFLTCAGLEKGEPGIVNFAVRSNGHFDTFECGAGKAISDWRENNNIVPGTFERIYGSSNKGEDYYQAILDDLKYAIDFNQAVGQFYWHNPPKDYPDKPLSSVKQPTLPKLGSDTKGDWTANDKEYVWAGILRVNFPVLGVSPSKPPWVPPDPTRNHCTNAFEVSGVIVLDIF